MAHPFAVQDKSTRKTQDLNPECDEGSIPIGLLWGITGSTMCLALPPASAVTKGWNPLSLLPKQAGGLGLWCPKTVCPSFSPSGSF